MLAKICLQKLNQYFIEMLKGRITEREMLKKGTCFGHLPHVFEVSLLNNLDDQMLMDLVELFLYLSSADLFLQNKMPPFAR